jgi:carboxymethylenebutenolidase
MVITTEYVDIPVTGRGMRTHLAIPRTDGRFPGILFYSDIFQLTGPMLRACERLAGHGFVVAAPEIYHRIEPAGTVIPFDDAGRTRGLNDAARTPVAHFDADGRAALDFLDRHPRVAPGKLGVAGFCLGGHLAFRGAFQSDVRATVSFYPTGLHTGKLGRDDDAGSLERAKDIRGELLLIFGSIDPHVPNDGRAKIEQALQGAGVRFSILLYPGEHAFMRDEGPRYDPDSTDQAWSETIRFLRQVFES